MAEFSEISTHQDTPYTGETDPECSLAALRQLLPCIIRYSELQEKWQLTFKQFHLRRSQNVLVSHILPQYICSLMASLPNRVMVLHMYPYPV